MIIIGLFYPPILIIVKIEIVTVVLHEKFENCFQSKLTH
jgi:hypothetical protein